MRDSKHAFTLIELMIVMVVIGILVGFLSTALYKTKQHARRTLTQTELRTIGTGIRSYRTEYGVWPYDAKVTTGVVELADNNYLIFDWMRAQNSREIRFISWNDIATTNSAGERTPYGDAADAMASQAHGPPVVDPWGRPYKIRFEFDYDRGIISCQTKGMWGQWQYKGGSGDNNPPSWSF